MLFFKKSKTETSDLSPKQRSFLDEADEAYMLSYMSKSIRQLERYMSRECVVKVSRAVYSSPKRYFGAAKFRKTIWTLIEFHNGEYVIRKDVKFDSINLNGILQCSVSNDYTETWTLSKDFIITDITQN